MESILLGLQSNQIPTKVKALEDLVIKLENPRLLINATSDFRMRLFSTTIHLIKDANPKVVVLSLDCLTIFLDKYSEHFQSLANLAFDIVIGKLGDAKSQIRAKAIHSFISLVNFVGLVIGYQKLTPLFTNKNSRIREQVLSVILQLHIIYGDEIAVLPEIVAKTHPLLKDPIESTRQLAIQVCGCLYQTMGESLVLELRNAEIKSNTLLEAIRQAALVTRGDILEQEETPDHDNVEGTRLSLSGPPSPLEATSNSKPSANLASTLENPRPKSYDGRPTLRSPVNSSSRNPSEPTDSIPIRRVASGSNSVGTDSSEGTTSIIKYMPSIFFGLLGDGQCSSPIYFSSEREFTQKMTSIQGNLTNKDDWQARQGGFFKLQSILKGIFESPGERVEYLTSEAVAELFIGFIRSSLHETIASQISDLRSTISKEASRTVAMMARVLRSALSPLVELWVPSLLKLLLIKIQVIMSSADRCLRAIIVCAAPNGIPKVIQILLESLSSKSSIVRKYSFEFLTLAAISWESDFAFERNSAALKKAIQAGVTDADPQARKTARVLYWLMRQRPSWNRPLQLMLDLLDNTARKHLDTEQYQTEFLEISRNRAYLSNIDLYDLDWKEVDAPQLNRNGSLSSSGRVSLGSDIQSLKSEEDEEDLRKYSESPEPVRKTQSSVSSVGKSSTPESRQFTNEVPMEQVNLREQTLALKAKKQFSASTGNLGKIGGISGGCQRLSMAPQKAPQLDDDRQDSLGVAPTKAPLSGSLMTKRLTKAASVRSNVPLDPDVSEKDGIATSSRLNVGPQRVMMPQRVAAESTKLPASNDKPLRVQRTPVAQSSATEIHPNSHSSSNSHADAFPSAPSASTAATLEKESTRPSSSDSLHSSIAIPSLSETKALINDSLWSNRSQLLTHSRFPSSRLSPLFTLSPVPVRILGLQAVNNRFKKWISSSSSDSSHPSQLEELLDLSIKCLSDSHQRVSGDANTILVTLSSTQNSLLASRLGILLPLLFNRLNDRKPTIRTQATEILDSIRAVHDPCTLFAFLSPRITDVPERTLVSILQFLVTIAPLSGIYLSQPHNTGAFLNRMAVVLSSSRRPSSSLILTGQRLLELVYKACTETVLIQISTLPLQHQSELKKALLSRVPNIDLLVASAAKLDSSLHLRTTDYNSEASGYDTPSSSSAAVLSSSHSLVFTSHPRPSHLRSKEGTISRPFPVDLNVITGCDSIDEEMDGSHLLLATQQHSPLVTEEMKFHSPIDRNKYDPTVYSPGALPLSQPLLSQPLSQSQLLSPSPIITESYNHDLPPTPPLPRMLSPQSNRLKENTVSMPQGFAVSVPVPESPGKGPKDIVWLLQTLRYDGGASRDEKKKAIAELKRLAKSASEDYWRRNCAQIVSVLLEAFTPPTRGLYDPLLPLSPQMKPTSNSYLPAPPLTGLSPYHLSDRDQRGDKSNSGGEAGGDRDVLEEEIIYNQRMEAMHIASKGLLILIKVLGKNHLKAFLELIVCRLCQAVAYAPVAISLHFQEILNLISSFDSPRLITLLLPYISKDPSEALALTAPATAADSRDDQLGNQSRQATRLLALQSLSSAVGHLSSAQLLELLPSITDVVLPHFTSSLVDIRKAVVFILVEIYMIIGDSLYPFVKGLAPSQRKLLTVYIDRQLNRTSSSNAHIASMPYEM